MKILMISGDSEILNEQSETHARMRSYATACDELHIVVLTKHHTVVQGSYNNLFFYPAQGNALVRRIRAYYIARSIARNYHCDVVTAQSPDELGFIAYRIARSFSIRFQLQVHTDIMSVWYRRAGFLQNIRYRIARFLLPHADCIRVVSRRIAESLARLLHISESRMIILPVFTDREKYMHETSAAQDQRHRRTSSCAMLAVGRFCDKEKNFSMLIRAMTFVVKKYSTATLVIVGDGPDEEYYRSLIGALHLAGNVFLEPWHNDMPAYYQSFDFLIIPSYIEGWGRVAIEAMASGLPVIMTDVGLAGEVVRDGVNGRIIPVADEQALYRAIMDLCLSPEVQTRLALSAEESVRRLSPSTQQEYLTQWKESFECCLPGRGI